MLKMIRRILKFSGRHARRIRLAFVFSFLKSVCANVPMMLAIMTIISLTEQTMTPIACAYTAGGMLAALLLQAVFQHISDRLQSAAGYEIFAEKRIALGEHLRRLPMGFFSEGNIGRVSSVLSADMVFMEENSMQVLAGIVSDLFSQLLLTAMMFAMHPVLGILMLLTEISAMVIAAFMNRESLEDSAERQQAIENMTGAILEYTEGIGIIKSFNMDGEGAEALRSSFCNMANVNISFEKRHTPWHRALLITYAVGTVAMLLCTVGLYESGSLSMAYMIGLLVFLFHAFSPMKHLFQQDARISIMSKGLDRIEALFAQPVIDDAGKCAVPDTAQREIEFDRVCFSYEKEAVLHDISFSARKGETVALVGASGSGKTTIANLLARFWDVSSGEIRVRGMNIRDIPVSELMKQVSMVFQRVYLFRDTVYNNIAMGRRDASQEEVFEAARKAECYDFIMKLPYGFQTVIGEGGSTLSGGEAQRISIARCILKDAPIIILDEATASIDADNESRIQQAIRALCRNKTTIVIAHKLGTIKNADQIIVLDRGRIQEAGNHKALMKKNGMYRKMIAVRESVSDWSGKEASGA